MPHLELTPIYHASSFFYACDSAWALLDQHHVSICVQQYFFEPQEFCFTSRPFEPLNKALYVRYWNSQDPAFEVQGGAPKLVSEINLLLFPQEEKGVDFLITVIGKTILGLLLPPLSKDYNSTKSLADAGELSLPDFQYQNARHEYERSQSFRKLAHKCRKLWPFSYSISQIRHEFPPSAGALLTSTVLEGGLSAIQGEWVERYQSKYCKNFSEDSYSCKVTPNLPSSSRRKSSEVATWLEKIKSFEILYPLDFAHEIFDYYQSNVENHPLIQPIQEVRGAKTMRAIANSFDASLT